MNQLNKPSINYKEILEDVTDNLSDLTMKTAILEQYEYLFDQNRIYEEYADVLNLVKILPHEIVNDSLDKSVMIKLYNNKFAKLGQKARKHYDKILSSTFICPYCGLKYPKTLDHYLPKSKYPSFSISPINLIPACIDCNTIKRGDILSKENEVVHPYFRDFKNVDWLKCELIHTANDWEGFNFYINPELTDDIKILLENHMRIFNLDLHYNISAIEEISSHIHSLCEIYKTSGDKGVKDSLNELYISSFKYKGYYWKSVLYRDLSNNKWFTEGNFLNVLAKR